MLSWGLLMAFTHRAAPLMLALFVLVQECVVMLRGRNAWRARWRFLPRWLPPTFAVTLVAIASGLATRALTGAPAEPAEARRPFLELLQLRSLTLFDHEQESIHLILFGTLLLVGCGLVWSLRRQAGERVQLRDGPLLAAGALLLASLVLRGENADLHYVVERTQWVALLLLALWTGSGLPGPWPLLLGVPAMLLHLDRLRYTEERMSGFLPHQQLLEQQAAGLPPGTTVIPVPCGNNWLYLHRTAFLAALHDGVVWTPIDHLRFRFQRPPDATMTAYAFKRAEDWGWLEEHLVAGREPKVDLILIEGTESARCATSTTGMGDACSRILLGD